MYWIIFIGFALLSWLVSASLERKFKRYSKEALPLTGREVAERMLRENGIELIYTADARRHIADVGFDPIYGARPIKRAIQREVVNTLSKRILAGAVDRSTPIRIDADADGLVFSN